MSINVCEVKRSVISRSDGIPCVYLSPGTRLCLGSINASNMLNCFIFILQSPQYLWVIWGTGTFVVWGRKCKVKQHSDQGSRGEGLTIVFLWGCWKQEMFPNTSQTPKGKSRNKGVFSFCQTKDMLKLFCRGAWKYRVLFLPSQIIARRVGKFYFQKHHHIFRAVNCWCFSQFPLLSAPAVFPALIGFISSCLQSVTLHSKWWRLRQVDSSQISLKLERMATLTLVPSVHCSRWTAILTCNLIKMLVK